MYFIGQKPIMEELSHILPRAITDESYNPSLLFLGKSGHGKTDMGIKVAKYLAGNKFLFLLSKDAQSIVDHMNGCNVRVVLIDEVHLTEPIELLYPYIDRGNRILLFTSNQGHLLNEALRNRCINLQFQPYSSEELIAITRSKYPKIRDCSDEIPLAIVSASNNNPRVITQLCRRLDTILGGVVPRSVDDINQILNTVINIQDGLDINCRLYLTELNRLGGTASLDSISMALGLSRDLVKYEIEPILMYQGKIIITSKGRTLCQ